MILSAAAIMVAFAFVLGTFFVLLTNLPDRKALAAFAGALVITCGILAASVIGSAKIDIHKSELALAVRESDHAKAVALKREELAAAHRRHMTPAPWVIMRGPDVRPTPAQPDQSPPADEKPKERAL